MRSPWSKGVKPSNIAFVKEENAVSNSWSYQSLGLTTARGTESEKGIVKKMSYRINLRHKIPALAFGALAFATMFASSRIADAGQTLPVRIKVVDSTVTALQDNCDPSTGLPLPGDGACAGIQTTLGNSSGSLAATYVAQINFAVLTSGEAPFTSFDTFTGSLKGRGAGSFTALEIDNITPSGKITGIWNVVEGSGAGNLKGISGWGSVTGTYDPTTVLATGYLSGFVHFDK